MEFVDVFLFVCQFIYLLFFSYCFLNVNAYLPIDVECCLVKDGKRLMQDT